VLNDDNHHRRNLFVMCGAIIIWFVLGAHFPEGDGVRFLVVNAEIKNPQNLTWVVWVLFVWFWWRWEANRKTFHLDATPLEKEIAERMLVEDNAKRTFRDKAIAIDDKTSSRPSASKLRRSIRVDWSEVCARVLFYPPQANAEPSLQIRVADVQTRRAVLRYTLDALLTGEAFGDWHVPRLLATFTAGLGFGRYLS